MKKFVTMIMIALVAVSASAASIDWTISGRGTLNNVAGDAAAGATIYFILADDMTSLASATAEDFATELAKITLTSVVTADGKKPSVDQLPVDSSLLVSGKEYTFGMLYYETAKNGDINYKYVTSLPTAAYTTGDASSSQIADTSFSDLRSASFTTVAVPEPASAMLALAGVAMLIRRRK